MKKSSYLPIIMAILVCQCIYAYDQNITLNYSQLPINTTFNITLYGYENITYNISYDVFLSGFTNVLFGPNATYYNLSVLASVSNATWGNRTSQISFKSSNESYNFNYIVYFGFINDTKPKLADFIMIDFDEYEYAVCDYATPINLSKNISITTKKNTTVNITYDGVYFDIIHSFYNNETETKTLPIYIHLPKLEKGYYTRYINFSIEGQNYSNLIFHFNVNDCLIPILSCTESYNNMNKACVITNMTAEQILECKRLTIDYEICIYDAMKEAAGTKYVNNTVIEYVNYTERVPVLDLKNPEIANAIAALPESIQKLIEQNKKMEELSNQIAVMRGERETLFQEAEKRMKDNVKALVDENNIKQNTIDYYKDRYIKKSVITIWSIIIISLGGTFWLFILYNENYFW